MVPRIDLGCGQGLDWTEKFLPAMLVGREDGTRGVFAGRTAFKESSVRAGR